MPAFVRQSRSRVLHNNETISGQTAAVADSEIIIRMIDRNGFWTMEMISSSFATHTKHTMEWYDDYNNNNIYAQPIMLWPS